MIMPTYCEDIMTKNSLESLFVVQTRILHNIVTPLKMSHEISAKRLKLYQNDINTL